MKYKLLLLFTIVIAHFGFGQIGFEENIIFEIAIDGTTEVFSVDIDGDGDMDALSASFKDEKIVWYKNLDGQGSFGFPQTISAPGDGSDAKSVKATDIDGDGDMDVIAGFEGGRIAWYENTNGQGTFGTQQIIDTIPYQGGEIYISDLDGDGDMDVISSIYNNNKVVWYENTDGLGTFGAQQNITTSAWGVRTVHTADLDGDGDMDVLVASSGDSRITWYENIDGQGTFGPQQVISLMTNSALWVYASDIDGDGDMDVISAAGTGGSNVSWYENTDGQGTFGAQQEIASIFGSSWVYATDLDGDGDMDVLSASASGDDFISWHENTDGQGTFGPRQIIIPITGGTFSMYPTDLDGDGDLDMLTGSYSSDLVSWYENTDGQGTYGSRQLIAPIINNPNSVFATDIDGDGDMDVLSGSDFDDRVAWYENMDGQGTFSDPKTITTNADRIRSVYATDLDGDGDMDVLSASNNDHKIAWYENTDGQGTFGPQQIITIDANAARSVYASDLDGDGDMDVLSASGVNDDKIAWYENTDGQGTFGPQQIITTNANNPSSVFATDIDGDGDMDVLSSSSTDDKIAWYENTDGQGTFGAQQAITTMADGASSVYASDIDGDGDMDVLSSSNGDYEIAWYENTDGQGTFGSQQTISNTSDTYATVYATDLDGDGDVDVLSASGYGDTVAWYENTDGQGTFGIQQVITSSLNNTQSVYATDLDGDGDMDVLSVSGEDDKIVWYKNSGTVANEINGKITIDTDFNGCDTNDLPIGNFLVETTDGTTSLSTFSINNGIYQLFPGAGNFTTSIVSPIPNYYTVSPASATSNFTGLGNTDTVDFCLEPTGVHNDLNITVYPSINDPRPGFNTTYQIVYTNAGNTQLSGNIIFEFDDSKIQFLNASETVISQTANTLTFNFTGLTLFETRTIDLVFNVFPPPTTNIGDILSSTATINPVLGDETPDDNIFQLRQTVIGSYDPNDIRVLEGDEVLIDDIDKYLHYIIRFQNTGTASAINVRVEHILDSKLDWTTMQLQNMSHSGRVEITDGNNVEFIFDDINLADSTNDEPNSHGYIAFKIKPKSSVVVGDIINGVADIFFDFNPPITTNIASTEIIELLSVGEFDENTIAMFPNPAKDKLIIQAKFPIDQITVLDVNGKLLKSIVLSNSKNEHELNVNDLSQGIYFVKIQSNSDIKTQKFIKK